MAKTIPSQINSHTNKILSDNRYKTINNAFKFASQIHSGHLRNSGEPYLTHLTGTAEIILDWLQIEHLTQEIENIIAAALLHDSVEYGKTDLTTIQNKFGNKVQKLVAGVSDLRSNVSKNADNYNLKFIARKGNLDPRVFVIKLADRLHNMRTHQFLPKEKQVTKAEETMNVYVHLAESLGMWKAKKELEDICFKYIYPEIYSQIENKILTDPRLTKKFDVKILALLNKLFSDTKIKVRIAVNTNGIWTIYTKKEKAVSEGYESVKGFSNINDLKSFSVITDSENTLFLYTLLGLIHTSEEFRQFVDIKHINDYISKPQPNKFSAIQTTLNLPEGKIELHLTTKKRDEFNNYGITTLLNDGVEKLDEYKRSILFDEYHTAWFLPINATYYDFVYTTGIGPQASYVKIDGKKNKLKERIKNGAFVKVVLHNKNQRSAKRDVLNFCLPETKILVEKQIYLGERDKLVKTGKKMLEKALIPRGILNLSNISFAQTVVLNTLLLEDTYELYYRVASGNLRLSKISEVLDKYKITKEKLGFSTLRISGKNKPGILGDVINLIKNNGGNIYNILSSKPLSNATDKYSIRILFKGVDKKSADKIKKILTRDKRINKLELV